VITIEPGIYRPGNYGIRIEDTVLVGVQPAVLTHYTKDLVFLG
jgi:Xaa-Pro aminopeptidase